MAVGEEDDIVIDRLGAGDDPVATLGHLVGGLPSGSRAGEDGPGRVLLADLLGGDPLVLAVVPLGEVVRDLCAIKESGQLAGALRAGPGTAEDELEIPVGEFLLKRGSLTLPLGGERDVAEGSVASVLAPLGFTVADEDDLGAGGAHGTERMN